tara:strand:+ start:20054 stop:20302 length:249 start_codon:yes stop_codon:yes gene_type:complete
MAHIETIDGQSVLTEIWHIEDVYQAADDMGITITDEEAEDVLCSVANNHDCNIGINWEVFYYHLQRLCDQETQDKYEREDDA